MATNRQLLKVEPAIWRACAGTSVHIPAVNSRVYYFPQGHSEQSASTPSFSPLVFSRPYTLCRVLAVGFFANPETDEVFVKMHLLPVSADQSVIVQNEQGDVEDENDVVSFSKILTPSDANNGGGFSVPRFCADSIFPPLNFEADPPVQNLGVRDVHGVVWEFRHIYRGTPRRHLLTTGWSKFVNNKKLVAGDSVVFMRNRRSGEISVGIRRAVKANADCNGRWNYYEDKREREGFSRNVRGRVAAEAVEEAAQLAAKGLGFEIVYYPGTGSSDFVVKAEKVERSFSVFWTMGMRVKMAVETEDSSRMTWYQGTVSSAVLPDNGHWRGSPWRMLQVTWDEPEALQNLKRVSPWQVESVVATPSLHTEFHPTKKCRLSQDPGLLLSDGDGELLFPMPCLSHSLTGQLNPSWMNFNTFPAGIQGARQDQICVSGVPNNISETSQQICSNFFVGDMSPMAETTELNIGSAQVDNLSPDSHSSVHFFGNEQVGKRKISNFPPKVGISSFQLFGKIIHTTNPVEGGFDDVKCTGEDGNKIYRESSADQHLKRSLTYPFTEFCETGDVQCQRDSASEDVYSE
ncbi:Auxin response factor [Heracleum sosnowskyi]|uniref:Auxin response factor n=1 Tax=Heracleum sosnowskyi TaxID=360622 RepID=A0AAD8JH44_9APIA|nr:Auxin response factor [Heracleum sosnowskyi]